MASLLDLAQARLQGLLDIPTRVGRAVVNPTLFSGLLGAPTLPKETGMAQAAYGLPAQPNMSVLDPEQRAYLEGYAQGEPYSYLGMAAPFAAPAVAAGTKAVAPKAGMALENYMASQGLLQPLTAYHGTPHTIRGQFDISKVGTGEGAQAYGHGMYFAENPAVAKNYMEFEGLPSLESKVPLQRQTRDFLNEYVDPNTKPSDWLKGAKEDAKANNRLDILAELNKLKSKDIGHTTIGGNLYKVDIPDEYIPNMLDWDKPLKDQPKAVQKALEKYDPDMYSPKGSDYDSAELGQSIYQRIIQDNVQKYGLGGNSQRASEQLNALGIKGIRYFDEGSRDAKKGTSNFVVFDPTDVKILEKNSEKVEGLLE